MEVDEGNGFFASDLADRLGIVTVGVGYMALFVKGPAMHRCYQNRSAAVFANLGHEPEEIGFVARERADAVAFFFFIVVAELDDHKVAAFHGAEDFIEAMSVAGAAQCFAGLGVVGDGDSLLKKAWQHLTPAGPWFNRLVAHGRIAHEVNGWDVVVADDFERCEAWARAVELKGEAVVPGPNFHRFFPWLEGDDICFARAKTGSADVDDKRACGDFAWCGADFFYHQPAEFGFDGGA